MCTRPPAGRSDSVADVGPLGAALQQHPETTDDGRITLQAVECLCACEAAPMMQVDDRYELNLTPEKVDRLVEALR